MGQYWIPVNLDKKEFVNPHEIGCGLKLNELIHTTPNILTWLIHDRWYGNRIALVGDSNSRDELLYAKLECSEEEPEKGEYKNISQEVVKEFSEYSNMELIPNPYTWGTWKFKER